MRTTILIAAMLLCGCASGGFGTMDEIMASWRGATADEAIAQWGYPHEERTVVGHHLLVWHRDLTLTMPVTANTAGTVNVNRFTGIADYQGNTTYSGGGSSQWGCDRILEIDAQNRVIQTQWSGNNCPFMETGPYSTWRKR